MDNLPLAALPMPQSKIVDDIHAFLRGGRNTYSQQQI